MIPTIDPKVRYGTTSLLREIAREIKAHGKFEGAAVIADGGAPVAVVVEYAAFLEMQMALAGINSLERQAQPGTLAELERNTRGDGK
jgi:hypothetical protein